MTIKTISLTFAERNMIEYIFNSLTSVVAADASMIKAIRKGFDTKEVAKQIEKFSRKAREAGLRSLDWNDLIDGSDYEEGLIVIIDQARNPKQESDKDLGEKGSESNQEERINQLEKLFERLHKIPGNECQYSIDDLYLKWFRDLTTGKFDLAKRTIINQQGQAQSVEVPPDADQIEVFASLVEKIKDAAV